MPESTTPDPDCAVWSYAGYKLDKSNFTTAMVHYYRAEVQRSNVWRNRLDTTTNWGVVTTAGALTFSFSSAQNPHFILLLVYTLIMAFINIEARRYRYYALWSYRVRLMENEFFATMVAPPFRPAEDWGEKLADILHNPDFLISWWEAIGLRVRRNFIWLITLLLVSWIIKLNLHPYVALDLQMMVERAAIGNLLPGAWVMAAFFLSYLLLIGLALLVSLPPERRGVFARLWRRKDLRSPHHEADASKDLATIITLRPREISDRLIHELGLGVTEMRGTGMYTGEERFILLCALTQAQVPRFERIVREVDAHAFCVVSPTLRVRGGQFKATDAPS